MSRYLGTSLEDNVVSIFMQFVPGGSIANVLARFGALEEEVFCNYTKQILEGVEYLHQNNVIHRCAHVPSNKTSMTFANVFYKRWLVWAYLKDPSSISENIA